MNGDGDLGKLYDLFEEYMYIRPENTLTRAEHQKVLQEYTKERLEPMLKDLFSKEHDLFVEYIRALALSIGDLFKEDYIAGLLNISRRKVRKFMNVLLSHNAISFVPAFYEQKATELSRHNKVYFTDMRWYAGILGDAYAIGEKRLGTVENFIFLELTRKTHTTHEIRFWRKKSGTEVPFVLIDRDSKKLTPISISLKPTNIVPRALKSFYERYRQNIEYSMFLNETVSIATQYQDTSLILLPYPLI